MKLTYNLHFLANIKQEEQQCTTIQLNDKLETNIENLVFVHKTYFLCFFLSYFFLFLSVINHQAWKSFCRIVSFLFVFWCIISKKKAIRGLTLEKSEKVSDFVYVSKYMFLLMRFSFCAIIILIVWFFILFVSETAIENFIEKNVTEAKKKVVLQLKVDDETDNDTIKNTFEQACSQAEQVVWNTTYGKITKALKTRSPLVIGFFSVILIISFVLNIKEFFQKNLLEALVLIPL